MIGTAIFIKEILQKHFSMKRGVAALTLLIIAIAVQTQQAESSAELRLSCRDTGALYISNFDGKQLSVYAKRYGSSAKFPVPGEWSRSEELSYFTSEEAVFVNSNKTAYTIYIGSKSYSVSCPAFVFSCRIINISADACFKRGEQFTGRFYAYNFKLSQTQSLRFEKPFLLTYKAKDATDELVHSPGILSPDFRNISISVSRQPVYNRFSLRWNTTRNITRFSIQYGECATEKYNFYDSVECSDRPLCSSDSQCLSDEGCEDGACSRLKCGSCGYIENHQCKSYECCKNEDCSESDYCAKNYCLGVQCLQDEQVENHGCTKLQCGPDEHAVNGTCIKLECADDEHADKNTCTRLECREDESPKNHLCEPLQCKGNEKAEKGKCTQIECRALEKAKNHQCVSIIADFFASLFH